MNDSDSPASGGNASASLRFDELGLSEALLRSVRAEGYQHPTPIQRRAIPQILAGRDVLGCAQTGTGKTAAFALPILQQLSSTRGSRGGRGPRALILSPTRELASQIGQSFATYGRHTGARHAVVFGGVGHGGQFRALRRGVDVLIATPGRLLDLFSQGAVDFRQIETFVLDEADRMLDMGFIHDVRRIVAELPAQRQTLFFSATMPSDITALARSILTSPVRIEVAPQATTADRIQQAVYLVEKQRKRALLQHLLDDDAITRALVFTRTKHGANRLCEQLRRTGIAAEAIHGNKSQSARESSLKSFRQGRSRVLVATDVAARGIDVDGISHVINYELPNEPESYVHRIGRTGRAGADGIALSFCELSERPFLRAIERLIRQRVTPVDAHPFASPFAPAPAPSPGAGLGRGGRPRSFGRGQGRRRSSRTGGRL